MARRSEEIAGFQFRLGAVLAVRYGLQWFFVWTMIWATAAVLLRIFWRIEVPTLLWGALGYVPAAVVALRAARRRLPPAAAVRALLDRHAAMGGLVMAAGEAEIGDWRRQIARLPLPAVRLQARRHGGLLFCAAGLLAAGLLVPEGYLPSPATAGQSLQLDEEVQQLAEKIDVLKGERILRQDKALALEKDLKELRQEATAGDPAKTMEAIDHLEQSFQKTAEEAKQEAIQHVEQLSHAEDLADALHKCEPQMDPRQFDEAMKELARMTDRATSQNDRATGQGESATSQDDRATSQDESASEDLEEQLKQACKEGKLTAQQLERLSQALQRCKQCERAKVAKMADKRLIDPADLRECDKACEGDWKELAEALKACQNGDDLAGLLAKCENGEFGCAGDGEPGFMGEGGEPGFMGDDGQRHPDTTTGGPGGRGGRGGGGDPTAMTWSKGVDKSGAAFKESILPPAAVASLKKSQLLGTSIGQPRVEAAGHGSAGGALSSARAGAGSARTQVILPEHQRTVNRYFSREGKS